MPGKSPRHAAAALTRVAREGGTTVSAPARDAWMQSFVDQVDPNRTLPEDERSRRASAARRAHMLGLAARSIDSRRRKSEAAELRALADAIETGAA
jgi:hypothetical protein